MTTSQTTIEKARKLTSTGTNYAVAKLLNIDPSDLNRIIEGTSHLGLEACYRAADLLKMDVAKLIASVQLDKAKLEKKAFWKAHAAAILAALVIAQGAGKEAYSIHAGDSGHTDIFDIMRTLLRRITEMVRRRDRPHDPVLPSAMCMIGM